AFTHIARSPALLLLHLAFTIFAALLLGVVFIGLDMGLGGTQDRTGFLYFIIFFFALTSIASLPHLVQDKRLFLRERDGQFYTTLPYLLSKILCDLLPLRVIPPLLFGSIVYCKLLFIVIDHSYNLLLYFVDVDLLIC